MAGATTVYHPASPHSLSQASHLLTFTAIQRPFDHNGFIGNQNNVGYGSIGDQGNTQNGRADVESPVSSIPGAFSALGIEPGPASVSPHGGMSRFQTAPTLPSWADDQSSLSPPSLEHPPLRPTLTVTHAPSDGLTAVDPAFSKNLGLHSGPLQYSLSWSQCPSPSSPNWPAAQLCAPGFNLLVPQLGPGTPSSLSAFSSPSASPASMLSALSIHSPPNSVREVDDDPSSRPGLQPEGQVQGDLHWEADGRAHGQAPLFPMSPPGLDNGAESLGRFLTALPTTPSSTTMDIHVTASNASSNGDPGPSQHLRSISGQNFYSPGAQPFGIGGMETLSENSLPDPTSPPLPSTTYTNFADYRCGNTDFGMVSRIPPSSPPGAVGHSFSPQVDESYEAAFHGYYPPYSSTIPASSIHNSAPVAGASRDVYLPRQLCAAGASARKKGAWSDEASRAKKVVKQTNNQLLHASIASLEREGRIPQMSSLRDTVRFIIARCFEESPTRQNIVDLLFGALPERVQEAVVEVDVKKYYKDRIGHILSAPANRNIFSNISGTGRWVLAEPLE
ncbi:hypothetical protein FRC01_005948 [Tulasnella sp. 417]|nr:hypothetical protein FRC01_005948 [Tulasnella sp. 417]